MASSVAGEMLAGKALPASTPHFVRSHDKERGKRACHDASLAWISESGIAAGGAAPFPSPGLTSTRGLGAAPFPSPGHSSERGIDAGVDASQAWIGGGTEHGVPSFSSPGQNSARGAAPFSPPGHSSERGDRASSPSPGKISARGATPSPSPGHSSERGIGVGEGVDARRAWIAFASPGHSSERGMGVGEGVDASQAWIGGEASTVAPGRFIVRGLGVSETEG